MTTSRFPARRAGTMVCGHPIACMYRWKAPDGVHKYCVACLFEQSGLKDVDLVQEEYKKEVAAKIAEKAKIVEPETLTTEATIATAPEEVVTVNDTKAPEVKSTNAPVKPTPKKK